jgi:ketosteroid isomerase-like protein
MKRLIVLGTGLVFVVLLAFYAAAPAASHPGAVRDKLQDAINRGDLAGAVAMWTDDALIDNPITCAEAPCVGKAGVQKDMERRINAKNRPKTLKHYVSGNLLTTRTELRSNLTEKAGVDRIILWLIYEVKGEKIAWERGPLYERNDAQTAKYLAWQKTQQPAR